MVIIETTKSSLVKVKRNIHVLCVCVCVCVCMHMYGGEFVGGEGV